MLLYFKSVAKKQGLFLQDITHLACFCNTKKKQKKNR